MVENLENETKGTPTSNVRTQIYAALIANCIILSHGINAGFLSPALPLLTSNETPLSTGPLTTTEISWLGAITSFGSICGSFVYGMLAMLLGSKRSMVYLSFPPIIFWSFIIFGHTFYHILIARAIAGLLGEFNYIWTYNLGGFYSCVLVFIAETSNDDIRGRLGAIQPLARNLGLLLTFSIGSFVQYKYWPYIFMPFPIIYLILLLFLTNTPQYYLQKGNDEKAKKALMFYKGWNENTQQQNILLELEFERLKSIEEERKKAPKIQLKDFCNRMALKGIFISIAISWFLQMTGCYTITNYASQIFEKSGKTIFNANISSIIMAIVQIFGGLLSTQVGDTYGRRATLAMSLLGSILGLVLFAGYLHSLETGCDVTYFNWVPLMSLSLIIFVTSAGIMALSNTCAIENFPTKIRSAGMIWYSFLNNLTSFIIDKSFPILIEIITLRGVLLVLALTCCFGLIFVYFMTETKGQPLDTVPSVECDSEKSVSKVKCKQ